MTRARPLSRPRAGLACLALATWLGLAGPAAAAKIALSDEEMSAVNARGIGIAVHLEINGGLLDGQDPDSRFTAGFAVGGTTTYAILQNFGGVLDMVSITLTPVPGTGGSPDSIAIGMPAVLATNQFGVRAIGVQTDPAAPLSGSLGSLLLNGMASMTGQVNVWPGK